MKLLSYNDTCSLSKFKGSQRTFDKEVKSKNLCEDVIEQFNQFIIKNNNFVSKEEIGNHYLHVYDGRQTVFRGYVDPDKAKAFIDYFQSKCPSKH